MQQKIMRNAAISYWEYTAATNNRKCSNKYSSKYPELHLTE
jgi:hypothetical protein